MIGLLVAVAAVAPQSLPNAPGAITPAPLLIDCLFPRKITGPKKFVMDEFAVLLPNGLTIGKIDSVEMSDPKSLIGGGQFDLGKTGKNGEISLLGLVSSPQPILTMFPTKEGPPGYDSAIGTVGGGGPRTGRCFFLAGPQAETGFRQLQAAAKTPERGQ